MDYSIMSKKKRRIEPVIFHDDKVLFQASGKLWHEVTEDGLVFRCKCGRTHTVTWPFIRTIIDTLAQHRNQLWNILYYHALSDENALKLVLPDANYQGKSTRLVSVIWQTGEGETLRFVS